MFEISVETSFAAAHAIRIHDELEPMHGHNWRVQVIVASKELDENDLVVDFHQLQTWLEEIVRPFRNRSLNEVPPFNDRNPTAERVAEYIHHEVDKRLEAGATLHSVTVHEAPGCTARFRR